MTNTQKFINEHANLLESAADYFNIDSALQRPDDYEHKHKFLLVFPTPAMVKTVSATVNAINDFFIEMAPDWFLDVAYLPTKDDLKVFDKYNLPYIIGHVTHLDPSHFDIVGFSISVLHEVLAIPTIIQSWSRCDKPIKLSWSERKDLSLSETPIIMAGGITASCADIDFGDLGDGRIAYLDGMNLGIDEGLKPLLDMYTKFDKSAKVQDVLDEWLRNTDNFYQPQAYNVVYKDNLIVENTKINPNAQDFVHPYYPKEFRDRLYVARTVVAGTGANAGDTQIQLSEACLTGDVLVSTTTGYRRLDSIVNGTDEVSVITPYGVGKVVQKWDRGVKDTIKIHLASGKVLECTPDHRLYKYDAPNGGRWVQASEFKKGDFLTLVAETPLRTVTLTHKQCEFVGRMLGDGTYNYKVYQGAHGESHSVVYLACAKEEHDYCVSLLRAAEVKYHEIQERSVYKFIIKEESCRKFGFIRAYDEVDGKQVKYIPDYVYSFTKSQMFSFLKGYHDADGTWSNGKVSFDCVHESIIKTIQVFCEGVGIRTRLSSRKIFNKKREGVGFKDTTSTVYTLQVRKEALPLLKDFNKFRIQDCKDASVIRSQSDYVPVVRQLAIDTIEFSSLKNKTSLKRYASRGKMTRNACAKLGWTIPQNWSFDEIVEIEGRCQAHVYDIQVEHYESFLANNYYVHNCTGGRGACSFKVSEDTYIHTQDCGIIKIKDYKGNQVLGVGAEKCLRIEKQSAEEVFVVKTAGGYELECSKDHKFMVMDSSYRLREVTTEHLEKGMVVLISTQLYDTHLHDDMVEYAELVGFMHGDGCYTPEGDKTRCQIYCQDGYELEHYMPLFKKYISHSDNPPRVHYKNPMTGALIWTSSARKQSEPWELGGLDWFVPQFVMEGSAKVKVAYLKGLFQADGWVNGGLSLTSINVNALKQVVLLLTSLGIRCALRENSFNERHKSDSIYDRKNSFYVRICAEHESKFIDLIGHEGKFVNGRQGESVENRTEANLIITDSLCDWINSRWVGAKPGNIRNFTHRAAGEGRRFTDYTIRQVREVCGEPLPNDLELVASGAFSTDTIQTIEATGVIKDCYDVVETESHLCVYNSILTHQCHEGWYCLPKGSMIKSNKGLTAIEDFKVGDFVVLNDKYHQVTDTVDIAPKPTITVETYNHQKLKVANTHLMLSIEDGKLKFKRAYDLKVGDYLAYERSESFGDKEVIPYYAYLTGLVLGDGMFYPDQNKVVVYANEKEVGSYLRVISDFSKTRHSKNVIKLSKQTKEVAQTLSELGLGHATAHTKRVPKAFFNATKESVAWLLRGMFDSDGTISISKNHTRLCYTTVNYELAQDVVQLLSMFGISAAIYKGVGKNRVIEGRLLKDSVSYDVLIVGRQNILLFESIGFNSDVKQEKFVNCPIPAWDCDYIPTFEQRLKALYREDKIFNRFVRKNVDVVRKIINGWSDIKVLSKRHHERLLSVYPEELLNDYKEASKYEFVQIVSLECGPEEPMYDISVEGAHAYSLQGWVSHNTGAWVENPIENVRKAALESKKYCAADSCKPLSFNALPDYTLIPTGGKFKRLSEISEDDKLINTRTDEAGIVGIVIAQPKEHFRFRLDRGPAAVMSKDHRQVIATSEGLKTVQANEIKVGDYIPYLVGYYKDQVLEFSEKHFLAGLWYGDGYLSGRNKRAYQAVACHEGELVKFVANSEFVDREVTTRDGIRHFLYNEEFGAFVKCLFPYYKYSDNNLTSLTVSEAVSFIRGWFNADGSASYKNSVLDVHLTASAKELQVLEWASTVLMSVGINNRISAPVRVSLSGHDKIHVRYDLYIRTRASERLVCGWFVEPLKNAIVSMALQDKKRSSSDFIPPFIGKWMSKNYPRVSGVNDYNFWSGLKAMSVERMEARYATYSGGYLDMIRKGWRFAKVEDITYEGVLPCRDVLESDDHMYLTGFGLTHNCNHYHDYTMLLHDLKQIFPRVTFINMRLEELAKDTEAWEMMKFLGASRLSAPIEGLSDRIRNGILNKNLSMESIETLFDFMIGQGISDLKVGLVWTGFENDEDWAEIREQIMRLKAKAAAHGKKLPIRFKACLTDEALTPVPYRGLLRQSLLTEGKVCGLSIKNIIKTKEQGFSPIVQVELQDGTIIKGTPWHPVLISKSKRFTDEGFKEIQDLKPGDRIYKRVGTEAYGPYQKFITEGSRVEAPAELVLDEKLAAVFGWYMGAGCTNRNKQFETFGFCFNVDEKEIRENITNILEGLGLDVHDHYQGSKAMTAIRIHNASWGRALVREFGHSASGKSISDLILQSPKSVQVEFLKHWFSAAGSVVLDGGYSRIKLVSINRDLLSQAKIMLENMGICSSVLKINTRCKDKKFEAYVLEIQKKSVNKFIDTIGFVGYKQSELVRVQQVCRFPDKDGLVQVAVKSVTPMCCCPEEETYGLEVEDDHTYITNGIVSHNTPLVHYPNTPFEFTERVTTRISYNGERFINDETFQKNRECGISIKFNGFIGSTFIEQAIVDLGRSLTAWMHQHIVKENIMCYNTHPINTPENMPSFKAMITNVEGYFAARQIDSYISPAHRIRIATEGGCIAQARKIMSATNTAAPTGKCLYTYQGCKTVCFKHALKKEGQYIHYADVKLIDGKLQGTNPQIVDGCDYCESPEEQINKHLKRHINKSYTMADIESEVYARNLNKYRIIISRNPAYRELNPNNTAYTSLAVLLRQSDVLLENYWQVKNHSFDHQTTPDLPFACSGIQVVDVIFRSEVLKELQDAIAGANAWLRASQIKSIRWIPLQENITLNDMMVYRYETSTPLDFIQVAAKAYRGEVKMLVNTGMQPTVEVITDNSLVAPTAASKGKTFGYFALPIKYNPYLYLQQVLKDRRIPLNQLKANFDVQSVLFARQSNSLACACGKKSLVSLLNNKGLKCPECLIKALTILELKK